MDLFGLMMLVYAGLYIFAVIYLLVKIFAIIKENDETKARIDKAREVQMKAWREYLEYLKQQQREEERVMKDVEKLLSKIKNENP